MAKNKQKPELPQIERRVYIQDNPGVLRSGAFARSAQVYRVYVQHNPGVLRRV